MKIRKRLLVIPVLIFLLSCSSEKVYRNQLLDSQVDGRHIEPMIAMLKLIKNKLSLNDHLLYVYTPVGDLTVAGNKRFKAVIYDYTNGVKCFFKNDDRRYIKAFTASSFEGFQLHNFVIEHYLQNDINYLNSSQNLSASEGVGGVVFLYELNSSGHKVINYKWEGIILDKQSNPMDFENKKNQSDFANPHEPQHHVTDN